MKTKRIKVFESLIEANLFLPEGKVLGLQEEGKKICLVRFQQAIYAVPDKCPHEGYPLSKGNCTKEGDLVCPWHKYSFNIKYGNRTNGQGYYLKPLKVEETDSGIFVEWPLGWMEAIFS